MWYNIIDGEVRPIEDISSRRAEYMEYIANFCFFDDDFMRIALDTKESVQLVIRIIIERDDLVVTEIEAQYDVFSIDRHSVRLDIRAVDGEGKIYNIEIQRAKDGAAPKRARFNSSLIDADSLKKGDDYDKLPEVYVLFITETDVLGGKEPLYHIDRIIRETGEDFDDQSHIVYVNGAIRDDTPLGRLMNDFACTNAKDMYYDPLAERMRYYKESEEGVTSMCEAMEKLTAKAAAEGRAEGRINAFVELVKKGLLTLAQAAAELGMSIPEFEAQTGLKA